MSLFSQKVVFSEVKGVVVMFKTIIVMLLVAIILSPHQEVMASDTNDSCNDMTSERLLLNCRKQQKELSEINLTRTLEKLVSNYKEEGNNLVLMLKDSQKKWEAFRDSECKLLNYYSSDGTAYEVYLLDCIAKMNKKRTKDLQLLIENP
jgi:uncharacterized protein YecT (DUF1311 family)